MRIQFVGTGYPSAKAQNLKTILSDLDVVRGIHKCQEAIAKMFGYKDWYELRTICERCTEDSPRDDAVPQTEAAERRLQYGKAIASKLEIDETTAFVAVDKLRPTGSKIALVHSAADDRPAPGPASAAAIGGIATYLITDNGPIALRQKDGYDLGDLNGDLAIPSFAGQTVRTVEVWWSRDEGKEALVLERCNGFYMHFNSEGRRDSSTMARSLGLAMAVSPSKRAEYQREHTWTVDTSVPFMTDIGLDIMVRAKKPGGKRLPTVSKMVVNVGRRKFEKEIG